MSYDASNTYATVEQVRLRLTSHGSIHATDKDFGDGVQDAPELAYLERAIEYANALIDEALTPHVEITPRPANEWLTDRCVDIACHRVQTLGGTEPDKVIQDGYDLALDKLEDVRLGTLKVPGLDYTEITSSGRRSGWPFRAVNVR